MEVVGQLGQGFQSQGSFAHAARAGKSDDTTGLEIGQELGQFGLTANEVVSAARQGVNEWRRPFLEKLMNKEREFGRVGGPGRNRVGAGIPKGVYKVRIAVTVVAIEE